LLHFEEESLLACLYSSWLASDGFVFLEQNILKNLIDASFIQKNKTLLMQENPLFNSCLSDKIFEYI